MKKKDPNPKNDKHTKKAERSVKKAASASGMPTRPTSARSAQTGQYKEISPVRGRSSVGHVLVHGIKKGHGTNRTPPPRDAAPSPPVNHAAIALLRSWRQEDPEQQRAVWDTLKQTLDEDRLSDRERVS